MKITDLPQDIREMAEANANDQKLNNMNLSLNPESTISGSFYWQLSHEGYHYWRLVDEGKFDEARALLTWIEIVGEETYEKPMGVKDNLQHDGFVPYWSIAGYNFDKSRLEHFNEPDHGKLWVRPKYLSGIDNNRGWIRIEPDGSNLPEKGDYHVIYEDKSQTTIHFNPEDDFDRDLMIGEFTHYQPIVKPEPPIY